MPMLYIHPSKGIISPLIKIVCIDWLSPTGGHEVINTSSAKVKIRNISNASSLNFIILKHCSLVMLHVNLGPSGNDFIQNLTKTYRKINMVNRLNSFSQNSLIFIYHN